VASIIASENSEHQSDQIQQQWDDDVNKVADAEQNSNSEMSLS
jgi:hypothetical protein